MKKRGLSQNQYESLIREDWHRFVVKPVIVIIGIWIVSVLLKDFMNIQYNLFTQIFTGIGGIAYTIYYYKTELNKND